MSLFSRSLCLGPVIIHGRFSGVVDCTTGVVDCTTGVVDCTTGPL